MITNRESFRWYVYLIFASILIAAAFVCICLGSVVIPFGESIRVFAGDETVKSTYRTIILNIRVPRVICVALTGAALSSCGCIMQGLLRNPLADGSTIGVSSGASLGAVLFIAFGSFLGPLSEIGTTGCAILFAFISLALIMTTASRIDHSLSTNTIILIGVIFSMFASSLMSLVITFSGEKVKTITFWTMGSLASASYKQCWLMGITLFICAALFLYFRRELNAFAIGEDDARRIGVNVKTVKLILLTAVSVLIGVCVSIGGTIGFVGLITPHMMRMITGPNHKKLLPASLFMGAVFLMLADLAARTLLSPIELPIGVVTSIVGAIVFMIIFIRSRKASR